MSGDRGGAVAGEIKMQRWVVGGRVARGGAAAPAAGERDLQFVFETFPTGSFIIIS